MSICHYKITTHESCSHWVVLIHGLFGSLDNLNMLAKHLASTANIIQIDLPDHGASSHSDNISIQNYVTAVQQTLQMLGISAAHFVGHSLGGKIAMGLALNEPGLVTSLVVADIAPVAYPQRHEKVFAALNHIDLKALSNRAEATATFTQMLDDEGTRQFLLKSLKKNNETGVWFWQFNLAKLQRDYTKLIAWPYSQLSSKVPTLFIKGAESDYILADHQDAIVTQFPRAKAHIIQGTGHWLHAQKPIVFNGVVSKFILAQINKRLI